MHDIGIVELTMFTVHRNVNNDINVNKENACIKMFSTAQHEHFLSCQHINIHSTLHLHLSKC